jgi:hypothetical protein
MRSFSEIWLFSKVFFLNLFASKILSHD